MVEEKGRWTYTTVMELLCEPFTYIDETHMSACLFLDLYRKAFNTLDKGKLFEKLKFCGFDLNCICQNQHMVVDNTLFASLKLNCYKTET